MLKQPQTDSNASPIAANEAYEYLPGELDRGVIILCDHARAELPAEYGTLGLGPDQFKRHIAYDIGARQVTSQMSQILGAPALMSNFSRLLIDLNRGLDDPTLVMRLSDGAVVPGNLDVDEAEAERRIERFHRPYHDAIDQLIDLCQQTSQPVALVSIHSFTDSWKGRARPWHASILWDRDDRLVRPFLRGLARDSSLVIGENVPYTGELEGDTLNRHGSVRGIAHALVEIRQDLIGDDQGQRQWAERLAGIIDDIVGDEEFQKLLKSRGKQDDRDR